MTDTANEDATSSKLNQLLEQIDQLADRDTLDALRLADQGLEIAEAGDDRELVLKVVSVRAQLHARLKNSQAALRDGECALAGFRASGNLRGIASTLNTLSIVHDNIGDHAKSILLLTECLDVLHQLDFPAGEAQVNSNIGLSCAYIGDFEEALAYYSKSLAIWETMPESPCKGNVLVNIGFAHDSLGNLDTGEKYFRDAIALYGKFGAEFEQTVAYCNLASIALKRNQPQSALQLAEQAVTTSQSGQDPARKAHAAAIKGRALAANKDTTAAKACVEQALRLYRSIELPRGIATCLKYLAQIDDSGFEASQAILTEALEIARANRLKPMLVDIYDDLYQLACSHNQWQSACQYLEQKVAIERELINTRATIKLQALHLESKLEQGRIEIEMERKRSAELATALQNLAAEKQRAEEENRQKSEILNFAAHDLRNMVWMISGPLELVQMDMETLNPGPEILENLSTVQKSTQILEDTLAHILNAAAIESGTLTLKPEQVRLQDLCHAVRTQWQLKANKKQQTIVLAPGDPDLTVNADRKYLLECMHNLVSNALKYSPFGSSVSIGWQGHKDEIILWVADQGPGISKEDLKIIARPFQRLSAQPTGGEVSLGLGLSLIAGILKRHGGRMEVDCPPAGGSVFSIVLPKSGEQPQQRYPQQ